jgi:hypothetical protein
MPSCNQGLVVFSTCVPLPWIEQEDHVLGYSPKRDCTLPHDTTDAMGFEPRARAPKLQISLGYWDLQGVQIV